MEFEPSRCIGMMNVATHRAADEGGSLVVRHHQDVIGAAVTFEVRPRFLNTRISRANSASL
eukprot:6186976-Pleurochrysis_carterae.AAC.1